MAKKRDPRKKWIVFSFDADADPGQVMVDVVVAVTEEKAVAMVAKARPYATVDGADDLRLHVANVKGDLEKSNDQIAAEWRKLKKQL